jgi:hypothetical protein
MGLKAAMVAQVMTEVQPIRVAEAAAAEAAVVLAVMAVDLL